MYFVISFESLYFTYIQKSDNIKLKNIFRIAMYREAELSYFIIKYNFFQGGSERMSEC